MNEAQSNTMGKSLQADAQAQLDAMDYGDIETAADEIAREMGVRSKCYAGWIEAGKLSKTDAKDRFFRIKNAEKILRLLLDSRSVPC